MHDKGIVRRAALGAKNFLYRRPVKRIGAQTVDGFRRKRRHMAMAHGAGGHRRRGRDHRLHEARLTIHAENESRK